MEGGVEVVVNRVDGGKEWERDYFKIYKYPRRKNDSNKITETLNMTITIPEKDPMSLCVRLFMRKFL